MRAAVAMAPAIPASGKYIRRSAPTSVAIGMMLDAGASVMKNHAPQNPIAGIRTIAKATSRSRAAISARPAQASATPSVCIGP